MMSPMLKPNDIFIRRNLLAFDTFDELEFKRKGVQDKTCQKSSELSEGQRWAQWCKRTNLLLIQMLRGCKAG